MGEIESITKYLWLMAIAGAFGVMIIAALWPRLFWPLLIVATVGTGGLMLNHFNFIDEIFVGCIVIGSFMALAVRKTTFRGYHEWSKWDKIHLMVFILLAAYMMMESFRGMIDLESPRKIRWVVYFGLLMVMLYFMARSRSPFGSRTQIATIISSVALVYFSAYFAHGFLTESFRGISRFAIQSTEWAGTSIAVFPMVIAIPAAMVLTSAKANVHRLLGWTTLLLMVVIGFYYDSRIAWFVILGFLAVAPFVLGLRKFALMSGMFALVMVIFVTVVWPEWNNLALYRSTITDPFLGAVGVASSDQLPYDYFREIHLKIAFPAISSSWDTFLFGYGFHATPEGLLGPLAVELVPPELRHVVEGLRFTDSTEGFTALVTDTGIVGLLLFGANFLLVGRQIVFAKLGSIKILLLASLVMTFGYLFVANTLDFLLFYLMIMPSGILVQLAKARSEQRVSTGKTGVNELRPHENLLLNHARF